MSLLSSQQSQVSSIRAYILGGVYTPIAVIGSSDHCACSEDLPLNRSENRSAARSSADNRLFPFSIFVAFGVPYNSDVLLDGDISSKGYSIRTQYGRRKRTRRGWACPFSLTTSLFAVIPNQDCMDYKPSQTHQIKNPRIIRGHEQRDAIV